MRRPDAANMQEAPLRTCGLSAANQDSLTEGAAMKMLALLLITSVALSACVAYEVPYRDGGRDHVRDRDRDGVADRVDRDRDGDGVSNRRDSRPDDARRY
jgi:hypothetical protein